MTYPIPNLRQLGFMSRPENFDATLNYWQRVGGVGPLWVGALRPQHQTFLGQPTDAQVEVAVGFVGNTQIEIVRPLDDGG